MAPIISEKKLEYKARLYSNLEKYHKVLLAKVDNVGSHQVQEIRMALRGKATVLFGKNTMVRKLLTDYCHEHADHPIRNLINHIVGNIALVFCGDDLNSVSEIIKSNRSPAPARAGAIAPNPVVVPAGPTGCDPGQTSFFQALNIATKIQKGQIEIINDVPLIKTGDKVLPGQAALLEKLSIHPFTYGMEVSLVYDNGAVYDAAVLSLTAEDIHKAFMEAVSNVASICLEIGYPTLASIPHSISDAFKTLVAIVANDEVSYEFDLAKPYLDFLANPSAFAAASAGAAGGASGAAATKEVAKEESSDDAGGGVGGLFDDDDF